MAGRLTVIPLSSSPYTARSRPKSATARGPAGASMDTLQYRLQGSSLGPGGTQRDVQNAAARGSSVLYGGDGGGGSAAGSFSFQGGRSMQGHDPSMMQAVRDIERMAMPG